MRKPPSQEAVVEACWPKVRRLNQHSLTVYTPNRSRASIRLQSCLALQPDVDDQGKYSNCTTCSSRCQCPRRPSSRICDAVWDPQEVLRSLPFRANPCPSYPCAGPDPVVTHMFPVLAADDVHALAPLMAQPCLVHDPGDAPPSEQTVAELPAQALQPALRAFPVRFFGPWPWAPVPHLQH